MDTLALGATFEVIDAAYSVIEDERAVLKRKHKVLAKFHYHDIARHITAMERLQKYCLEDMGCVETAVHEAYRGMNLNHAQHLLAKLQKALETYRGLCDSPQDHMYMTLSYAVYPLNTAVEQATEAFALWLQSVK